MLEIHVYCGYPTWISILDMYVCGYGGHPNIHVYYGYPTWISCLDIHDIHDIQRTELNETVDEDYLSNPEVHHFRAEALS